MAWIRVEDELPEFCHVDDTLCKIGYRTIPPAYRSDKVLVAIKGKRRAYTANLIKMGADGKPWFEHVYGKDEVTHWQLLPAVPIEGD